LGVGGGGDEQETGQEAKRRAHGEPPPFEHWSSARSIT
jgi:hypothetical protein